MPDLHLSRGRLVLSRGGYLLYGTSACFWQELAHFGAFSLPLYFVTMLGTVIDMYNMYNMFPTRVFFKKDHFLAVCLFFIESFLS